MERWQKIQERTCNALPDDLPQALATEGTHGPVIYATNHAAHRAGVTVGARVADMRALCHQLRIDFADPAGDLAALNRLALWARRWCPWTVADDWSEAGSGGGCGLVLDTTGADHLWGGEAAMLEEIEMRLSLLGFSSRLALAPTWGAAWAMARFGPIRAIWRGPQDVASLPGAALRLDSVTTLLLNRLGLKTIGDLTAVPRLSLARRFARAELAANPVLRLDQLTGHLAEPLAPPEEPPVFRADARLPEPILDPTHYLPGLCESLCLQLSKAGHGARRLRLNVYRTDGEVSRIDVPLVAPNRDPAHMIFLFRDRLERINPGFGFDLISLEAPLSEPLGTLQPKLGDKADEGLDLSRLVDRLTMRFGARALSRRTLKTSYIPERAEASVSPLAEPIDVSPPVAERPARQLDPAEELRVLYAVPEGPPAQFLWRGRQHRVSRYQGPERIAPEWWQDRPGTRLRDYFKVEDEVGNRFWLYREGLHDDGRGGAPRWFLHGVFA